MTQKPAQLTPAQRSLRARVAAEASWAKTPDRQARTAAARQAQLDRFEKMADPDGTMDPAERAQKAAHLRREHYTRMAYRSSIARSQRAAGA